METAIVVIAYNRHNSLKRLLNSIGKADYPKGVQIPLIISIDRSDNNLVKRVADDFQWIHGEKKVVLHEKNLGLKAHVLSCGEYVLTYGSAIILEDDLAVAPSFYYFAKSALKFCENKDHIAGISLYNHKLNVHVREPFSAIEDGYDNYYFQFAQSWGQAFSASQWQSFMDWNELHKEEAVLADNVPPNVSSWSDKSWLKYHIKYVIDTNRFFLYPTLSLTTNFSDTGTHATRSVNDLQVELAGHYREGKQYLFSELQETNAVYDAYFENMVLRSQLAAKLGVEEKSVVIDLYGYKGKPEKGYYLCAQSLPYRIVRSYRRALRPMDANVFRGIEGEELFLYDLSKEGEAPKTEAAGKYLYHYKALKVKALKSVLTFRVKEKFRHQ